MKKCGWSRLERHIALCLVTLLLARLSCFASTPQSPGQPVQQAAPQSASPSVAPTSPQANPVPSPQQATPPVETQTPTGQQAGTAPVGTAAAPEMNPDGSTASRPAGAAIAPAKQKRVHIYAIRAALIIGAAVAIGVVAGVSLGSPSKPH